jgi:imidazolonepropionase-like amidohydrolase
MKHRSLLILTLLIALTGPALYGADGMVAIKAGKVLTISGDPIKDGVVLILNGKILDVGSDLAIPEEAEVIDAAGKTVMPGLVSAGPISVGRGGEDENEQSSEITPTFRIVNAIDPASKRLKQLPHTGVTCLHLAPGSNNLIAGLGAVIKPTGQTGPPTILKEDASLWITLGSDSTRGNRTPRSSRPNSFYHRRPTTRMAVAWMIRKSFFDARQYAQTPQASPDPDMDILVAAQQGTIPIYMRARRTTDIRMALNLAREYDLTVTLYGCSEGHKMVQPLVDGQMPVILEPYFHDNENDRSYSPSRDKLSLNWSNPASLSRAGIKVALSSQSGPTRTDLLTVALFAVRHGMARDLALRAVTLTAAELLGVADRVGSIEKDKDADLLILSGDPLASTTRIERVFINGNSVFPGTVKK